MQRPRDKLLRTVQSGCEFPEHLPLTLVPQLDWSTLALAETSFVDEALRDSESNFLYTVQKHTHEQPLHLYLLFEHQVDAVLLMTNTTPDR